jgi:hypothetical protein
MEHIDFSYLISDCEMPESFSSSSKIKQTDERINDIFEMVLRISERNEELKKELELLKKKLNKQ